MPVAKVKVQEKAQGARMNQEEELVPERGARESSPAGTTHTAETEYGTYHYNMRPEPKKGYTSHFTPKTGGPAQMVGPYPKGHSDKLLALAAAKHHHAGLKAANSKEETVLRRLQQLAGTRAVDLPDCVEAEPSPEVAQLLARNFSVLANLHSSLPEWGSGNERPEEADAAKWKLTKGYPLPKQGHQYSSEAGEQAAYQSLSQALDTLKLPTSQGENRKVDSKEFVYRGQHVDEEGKPSWAHFKHRDTRNNIHLDLNSKTLVVPKTRKPFQRGEFDKVEHSDVYTRLRALSGVE